jgi:hypothetical protein
VGALKFPVGAVHDTRMLIGVGVNPGVATVTGHPGGSAVTGPAAVLICTPEAVLAPAYWLSTV